jgi:Xaa-Pro dipeptidase
VERIKRALIEARLDGLVCALPTNVLLLTGYWPVVGTSVAIATREGGIGLIVPEDERDLAATGWAHEVRTFKSGSLEEITKAVQGIHTPLLHLAKSLKIGRTIGYEHGPMFEPASYAAMHFYGAALTEAVAKAVPGVELISADALLLRLRSVKTPQELARIRIACRIAQEAFASGARHLHAGLSEAEVAARFREPLSTWGIGREGVERAGGFTFCMSGPNSARAYAAYQRSTARTLAPGDLALVHCNSYADGYWTDITRTFVMRAPDERTTKMHEAILAARQAALAVVKPRARAAEVDRAARELLRERGFGPAFKHPTGHGVGFAAINHDAEPCLHPASPARLETGMVFNVEPGVYFEGYGGIRHCDMVAVTETGAEVLTPFQAGVEDFTVNGH